MKKGERDQRRKGRKKRMRAGEKKDKKKKGLYLFCHLNRERAKTEYHFSLSYSLYWEQKSISVFRERISFVGNGEIRIRRRDKSGRMKRKDKRSVSKWINLPRNFRISLPPRRELVQKSQDVEVWSRMKR